nr:signal peptidase II [Leptolyngbya sp. 'hensonii']
MKVKNQFFWIAALMSLILDRVSKDWAIQALKPLKEGWSLWPEVFHLTYATNTGAAFSLFSGGGSWLRWLSLGVSLALMALAWFGPRMGRWEQAGYGLILGGAMGNGIDRFLSGAVVDFLHFKWINFPIFNLADVSINIGIACLLISAFVRVPASGKPGSDPDRDL